MVEAQPNTKAKLVLTIPRSGDCREFAWLLSEIDYGYNNFYAWHLIFEQATGGNLDIMANWPRSRRSLRRIPKPDQIVLPEDRLYLAKIEIASPGWIELIGALNPLETLRKILQDRHTRRQDREYRESAEAEKLAIENRQRRVQLAKDEYELLKRMNFPEDKIRVVLTAHIFEPAERLERVVDAGLIDSAKVVEEHGDELKG